MARIVKELDQDLIKIYFVNGEDVSVSIDVNQDDGTPYDFTNTNVEAIILQRSGEQTVYKFDITVTDNTLTFLLPKAVTKDLLETSYLSYLRISDTNQVSSFPDEIRFMLIPRFMGNTA